MLMTSNWRDWYHFQHQQRCLVSGAQFEDYVSRILERFHDDFINPAPAGTLGDAGCDGLADAGTVLYACYGQRPGRSAERELQAKIISDFTRGLNSWTTFHTWRFVTNAPVGPETLKSFTAIQQRHNPRTQRPLKMRIWRPERLWTEIVSTLAQRILDELYPGAPGIENLELSDLLPLLESLGQSDGSPDDAGSIRPVPASKMEFNNLPLGSQLEFNNGRLMAPRIDRWYAEASDPTLSDAHGKRFRAIYLDACEVTTDPIEILERIYVAVAGANFRMDASRANATYAVVSYFFDSCHIFETPPSVPRSTHAATN